MDFSKGYKKVKIGVMYDDAFTSIKCERKIGVEPVFFYWRNISIEWLIQISYKNRYFNLDY